MNKDIMLFVFSALSANAVLFFGAGIQELETIEREKKLPVLSFVVSLLILPILIWLLYSLLIPTRFFIFSRGLFLLPICAFGVFGIHSLFSKGLKIEEGLPLRTVLSGWGGLVFIISWLVLDTANSIVHALLVVGGSVFGIISVALLIYTIYRRSDVEHIPHMLRGKPLYLLSLALLSLLFTALASGFFAILT